MKWFRMYYEARTDKKFEALSAAQFRVWFNLLCFAAEQKENRGTISGYPRARLAIECANRDQALLEETLTLLSGPELNIVGIDGDTITFLHFKKRQYDHPSDAPEEVGKRVGKHRNEEKTKATQGETTKAKSVTTVKRRVTRGNDTEKEKESETDPETETQGTNVPCANAADAAPPAASAANGKKDLTANQHMWAVLREELHYEPHPDNKVEKGAWNGAIRSLLNVGETPETVRELVRLYRERWPGIDCTPNALVTKHSLIRSPLPTSKPRASPGGRAVDRSSLNGAGTDYEKLLRERAEQERRERENAGAPT